MEIGQIIPVAKYNDLMTRKWEEDYSAFTKEANVGNRQWTEAPQLAFYLFFDKHGEPRKRGYVLKYKEGGVICKATKRECITEKWQRI